MLCNFDPQDSSGIDVLIHLFPLGFGEITYKNNIKLFDGVPMLRSMVLNNLVQQKKSDNIVIMVETTY